MIRVSLVNGDLLSCPDISLFSEWLTCLSHHLDVSGEVCIKVVTESESQLLNRTYRGHDKPTNVLSFVAELPEFVESDFLGDLAICANLVESEAQQQNKCLNSHWAHLSIHGVLHLLGYDHIIDEQAQLMESLEVVILEKLNIDNPYTTSQL